MKIRVVLIFSCLIFLSEKAFGQTYSTQNMQDSIQLVQEEIVQLKQQVSTLSDSLTNYKKQYETINQGAEIAEGFIKNPIWSLVKYGAILLIALLGFLSLFFSILGKTNPKWFTKLIQNWVEKYEGVNQLKANKSILILSSPAFPNKLFIKKMMDKKGFKNCTYVKSVEAAEKELGEKDYQIILANNEDGQLRQDDLEQLILGEKYSVLFYYGKTGTWDFRKHNEIPEYYNRINFANSRAQVYGNLINSLNYHDTLI